MLKFDEYIKESNQVELQYYAFDWDDNILKMPTVIHMQKLQDGEWIDIDISTEDFAKYRNENNWRPKVDEDGNLLAYLEFRDFGPRGEGAFIEDTKTALAKKNYGPSWDKFIECLTGGSLFAIITARGHEPQTIRKGVEYIIDTQLTKDQKDEMAANLIGYLTQFDEHNPLDEVNFNDLISDYLDNCEFIGITSNYFTEKYPEFDVSKGSSSPEEAKKKALEEFVHKVYEFGNKIKGSKVKIGFSDDDPGNIEEVHKFFRDELSLKYLLQFNVYDTSDFDLKHGKRIKINEEFTSNADLRKMRNYDDNTKGGTWQAFDDLPKNQINQAIEFSDELDDESDEEVYDEYPPDPLDINSEPSNLKKYSSSPYGFWGPPQAYTSGRSPKLRGVTERKFIKNFRDF